MKRKSAPSLSLQAHQLQQRLSNLVQDYETSLGVVPVWIEEFDPNQALSLIGACLRVGLRLSPDETLQVDMNERAQAQRGIRLRRSSNG